MPGFISHFYATWTNARGSRHDTSLANGSPAHLRGWDAGVRITPRNAMGSSYGKRYSEQDRIELAMTGGTRSEDEGKVTALGRIVATPDGPRWEPADPPKPARIPTHVKTAGHPLDRYAMPVIAAIPVASHTNNPEPDEYVCVVLTGRWPSMEPVFGTVRATREGDDWVTESRAYDMGVLGSNPGPRSLTAATTAMVEQTGHSRPACTRPHATTR
jgi:hypothetical protein